MYECQECGVRFDDEENEDPLAKSLRDAVYGAAVGDALGVPDGVVVDIADGDTLSDSRKGQEIPSHQCSELPEPPGGS